MPKHPPPSQQVLIVLVLAFFFMLQGCAGDLQGIMREPNRIVRLHYDETLVGYETLEATLPDGEHFKGKFIGKIASSFGIGLGVSLSGASATVRVGDGLFHAVNGYDGAVEAVLTGDKGHSMRCRFKLDKPFRGFGGGGAGICQASDGRIIDVKF